MQLCKVCVFFVSCLLSFAMLWFLHSLLVFWVFYVVMAQFATSPSRKRAPSLNVVGITNVDQQMLSASFEGYILNWYGFYDVVGSGYMIFCMIIKPLVA
jgi:hypothetical protein